MKRVFLLTGSNLGESINLISMAAKHAGEKIGDVKQRSHVYSSESWGYHSADLYYNQCIEVKTESEPYEILEKILKIESEMGRIRSGKGYTDRVIDIDILFYGGEIINENELTIPHPRLHLRKFALVPMNEIAGDFIHPVFQKTIKELLDECEDKAVITMRG
jgi:2-amino-4-hydroxy-6-hydroxymethyldihydropteridine diphosphokinase